MPCFPAVDANGEVPAEHFAQEVECGSFDFFRDRGVRKLLAHHQLFGFVPVAEKTIVPEFDETMRKDMHKETVYEFERGDSHDFPLIVVPVIAPLE